MVNRISFKTYKEEEPTRKKLIFLGIILAFVSQLLIAQEPPSEDDYYRITTVPVPEGIALEVGGVQVLENGVVAVCTRRGDVWMIQNPTMEGGGQPIFKKFASGLHEPLGLLEYKGAIYTAQRGELTKISDTNGDGIADTYKTIYSWPLTANYHEYSYGPALSPNNTFFVTTNLRFGEEWWRGVSEVPWRGWTLEISEDGEMTPWATGMRSPAGYGFINGDFFYTDNQGDWKGSGGLWYVPKGAFTGHPGGLPWSKEPNSPVSLTEEAFYSKIDKRQEKSNGRLIKPENIQDEENPDFMHTAKEEFPELQLPAVVLPHAILGVSNAEVKVDNTGGKFGPFEGQVFIGDQGQSKIMRVSLEKVNGVYQGVAFDFKSGFQSGVLRMDFDSNGNMFVGETNRGWGSAGVTNSGLEYLSWTGKTPFEMKNVKAMPDGFEIEFTKKVAREVAEDLASYLGKSYTYKYHPVYGSPQTKIEDLKLKGVYLSDDGLNLRVVFSNLRPFYVHEVRLSGITSSTGEALLHPVFYYTLNSIPNGSGLDKSMLSTKNSAKLKKATVSRKPKSAVSKKDEKKVLSFAEVEPLLMRNTCVACHKTSERVIGPAFKDIAKRKYSDEKIVELIYNPQPKNWPEYATPMAPMPQVPENEALLIASWINSLDD